ncbi:MAG: Gldg family protein [Candidatus Marinimicrobia bacterium]|nr:Gldg family protein [Candidatus Neomarinimicrobiota bacterium]
MQKKVNNKKAFTTYLIIAVVALILINLISRNWFFRLDFTDNGMYSLSPSSKSVVQKTDDILTMKVYFSENLPGEYANNRRYLQDILEEYAAFSNGNIRFEFYLPDDDDKLELEAQKYGIMPVQLQIIENDKLEIKKVHMGLVLLYEDQREVIPIIQTTTGLEYEITTKIKKLVDKNKRIVGFGKFTGQAPKNNNITQVLQESYSVRQVNLTQDIPTDLDLILINGVTDSVNTDELDRLNEFIGRGGNVFLAQGRVNADLQKQQGAVIQSNIFDFISQVGFNLKENLVLDKRSGQVSVMQNRGFFRMNTAMDYPFFPLVREFGDHPIVKNLEQVRMIFPSEIETDTLASQPIQSLLFTSGRSGLMQGFFNLSPIQNPAFNQLNQPSKLVAALATVTSPMTGGVGQILLVSDSQFFSDDAGAAIPENYIFVHNAVDYMLGDSELMLLRSREITTRPLEELEDSRRIRLKWINILLPSLLIIGLGAVRWKMEAKRANSIEEIYG